MNIKMNWLKSLAVTAVVAMASANASAEVLSVVQAQGDYVLLGEGVGGGRFIDGVNTSTFRHPGGQLLATFSAECAVKSPSMPPGGLKPWLGVTIEVRTPQNRIVAYLHPARGDGGMQTLCSADTRGTYAITGVGNVPPGDYVVRVFGAVNNGLQVQGVVGGRSLVIFR